MVECTRILTKGDFSLLPRSPLSACPSAALVVVLFTAVFLPLATSLGVDPVMFGVFTVITCEIGFLTPPLGANLTVAARISGISIERISVAVLPFILAYIAGLLILIAFPDIATVLPNWLYGPAL